MLPDQLQSINQFVHLLAHISLADLTYFDQLIACLVEFIPSSLAVPYLLLNLLVRLPLPYDSHQTVFRGIFEHFHNLVGPGVSEEGILADGAIQQVVVRDDARNADDEGLLCCLGEIVEIGGGVGLC